LLAAYGDPLSKVGARVRRCADPGAAANLSDDALAQKIAPRFGTLGDCRPAREALNVPSPIYPGFTRLHMATEA
jgi:hypothetical protein